MSDHLTIGDRELIDRAIAKGQVKVVPWGWALGLTQIEGLLNTAIMAPISNDNSAAGYSKTNVAKMLKGRALNRKAAS
jgi:hypothetical protein